MRFRKLTLDSRDVFRKRHVHFGAEVSGWNDEFDCGGEAEFVNRHEDVLQDVRDIIAGKPTKKRPQGPYGVSKKEHMVSNYGSVSMLRGMIGLT